LIKSNFTPLSFTGVSLRDYTDSILAVYELNNIALFRDVFAWAYEQSARQYTVIRQELGEPDPIQGRYRVETQEVIRDVVVQLMDKPSAARAIRRWAAQNITASDRDAFVHNAEVRLLSLTADNGVRYRLRPSELASWLAIWRR
jgi:hypothetical protein